MSDNVPYDSRQDTLQHIEQVRLFLARVIDDLMSRAIHHDASKLKSPEKEVFDEFTPKLKTSTYGSEEYKGYLQAMGEALKHHYAHNSHHPEHRRVREEEWRAVPVPGFEDSYEVSNFGEVRSKDRLVVRNSSRGDMNRKGKLLTPHITPKGYLRLQLCKNGESRNVFVHSLVARAFISNPDDKPEVNHKNGIKTDNYHGNLEWSTASENLQHAYDTGLKKPAVKYVVTCNELDITTFGTTKMAAALQSLGYTDVSAAGVWHCVSGEALAHAGFTFTSCNVVDYYPVGDMRFMSLVDIVEMLCDWKAATLRHADGDIRKSIEQNQQRFGYSDELKSILLNTLPLLEQEDRATA
jgi:hypothetical protein